MRFYFIFFLSLLSITTSLLSQSIEEEYRIDSLMFESADNMGTAFIQKDYLRFTDFTYPSLVEKLGGKSTMAANIEKAFSDMEAEGIRFESVSFGRRSEFVHTEHEWQCILPQELKLTANKQTITVLAYLIAVTPDQGHSWFFIDTTDQDLSSLRTELPNLSTDLIIPKKEVSLSKE